MLSVYWDAIHGDKIDPRPIVTDNAEVWAGGNKTFKFQNEAYRLHYKHMRYLLLKTYLLSQHGIVRAHYMPDSYLFFAGSWVHWTFDHNGGITTGVDAAVSIGARPSKDDFFYFGAKFKDCPGWDEQCSATNGGLFVNR